MNSLFDSIGELPPVSNWRAEAPPDLSRFKEIYLNFETTGLRWWEQDRPIAVTIGYGDKVQYLPFAHRGGGNLDEAQVKRWAKEQIKHKRITNSNTRFEVHMAREWGVDFESQGNEVSDVAHYAALLDDHRLKTNIDLLVQDFLHETPMKRVFEAEMASYHASEVAPRALYTLDIVRRLKEVMWPLLEAQDLHRVRALEDKVIYPVCEMEKNGCPIDLELLDKWIKESHLQIGRMLLQLAEEVGFQCNPKSTEDMQRLFEKYKLPIEYTEPTLAHPSGNPSFTSEILKRIEHPTVKLALRIKKLSSLRSKFLENTKKNLDSHGILRYALHQLRAAKDENADAGEAGTVTGRFSSAAIIPNFGVNIQQRQKPTKQRVSWGYDEKDTSHDDEIFLVRRLHVAASGQVLSSDMDQAQYRIFASYINNPKVVEAYRQNPDLSFHIYMHEKVRVHTPTTYGQQKDLNFSYIFGAQIIKMGWMLGHLTKSEYEYIRDHKLYDDPRLEPTKIIKKIYEQELPEVVDLMAKVSHIAKPECDYRCKRNDKWHKEFKHQGFVRTYMGRRTRFPDGQRIHKAFNAVDQGTEADYMKTKLVELHAQRKETQFTLRVTNHDEVVGDIPDLEHAQKVHKLLNIQSFPKLKIPLTWSTGIGPNWAECKDI